MENNYDDIINLPHHRSKKHPHMSAGERAAQFSPFAALKGFDEQIENAAKACEDDSVDDQRLF